MVLKRQLEVNKDLENKLFHAFRVDNLNLLSLADLIAPFTEAQHESSLQVMQITDKLNKLFPSKVKISLISTDRPVCPVVARRICSWV